MCLLLCCSIKIGQDYGTPPDWPITRGSQKRHVYRIFCLFCFVTLRRALPDWPNHKRLSKRHVYTVSETFLFFLLLRLKTSSIWPYHSVWSVFWTTNIVSASRAYCCTAAPVRHVPAYPYPCRTLWYIRYGIRTTATTTAHQAMQSPNQYHTSGIPQQTKWCKTFKRP